MAALAALSKDLLAGATIVVRDVGIPNASSKTDVECDRLLHAEPAALGRHVPQIAPR
jgi:hypothetical protein